MSTVLGPAIEFAFMAGYVVAARGAAVPGIEDLVVVAASGARFVDAPGGLFRRKASLSPRLADGDERGDADAESHGGREECPEDRLDHEKVGPLPKPRMELMPRTCLPIVREGILKGGYPSKSIRGNLGLPHSCLGDVGCARARCLGFWQQAVAVFVVDAVDHGRATRRGPHEATNYEATEASVRQGDE